MNTHTDPAAGLYGRLTVTGWIDDHPRDGLPLAWLALTTPGDGSTGTPAPTIMPKVATELGLDPTPGRITQSYTGPVRAVQRMLGRVDLVLGNGETIGHGATSPEWDQAAGDRVQIMLVVCYEPIDPAAATAEAITAGLRFAGGLIPALVHVERFGRPVEDPARHAGELLLRVEHVPPGLADLLATAVSGTYTTREWDGDPDCGQGMTQIRYDYRLADGTTKTLVDHEEVDIVGSALEGDADAVTRFRCVYTDPAAAEESWIESAARMEALTEDDDESNYY